MGKLILVLGGARSGKSTYAAELADTANKIAYIATAPLSDDPEMKQRIEEHKKARPAHWLVVEEAKNVDKVLIDLGKKVEVVIIDCITLLITNWLPEGKTKIENMEDKDVKGYLNKEKFILDKIKKLAYTAKKSKLNIIMVSNEVGMGVHPISRLGRFFRDVAGRANRILAKAADEVYLMSAGIPLCVKKV